MGKFQNSTPPTVIILFQSNFCECSMWQSTRPGSVVVQCSPGMWEVGGSISDRVKQKKNVKI